jgi:uncharacterized protein (DUF1778 family)
MCDMKKDRVLNLRVDEHQRAAYERAAAIAGTSLSGLITGAADARAEEILHASSSMTVPTEVFEELWTALEHTSPLAPSLQKAFADRQFENR